MKLVVTRLFGVLLLLILAGSTFAQKPVAPSQDQRRQDYTFTVKAEQVWTDTGLDLGPGDRVHINGVILDCEGPMLDEKEHLAVPSAPGGALLAKLQPEEQPVSATPDADLAVVAPAHLYLGVNSGNCHGTVPVRVHVTWHQAAEQK
jgi:hypothetical protein